MKSKHFLFGIFFLFSLLPTTPAQARDDVRYWSEFLFKIAETEHVKFSLYTEGRFYDDISEDGLHLVSPKISYDVWKYVKLGTNYTFLQFKSGGEYRYQHRAEVEINPQFPIGAFAKFSNRNRVEFRWIEDRGSDNTRSRHRFRLSFPIKSIKQLSSIYIDSEFFYNWSDHRYDENRSVPMGLSFNLSKKVKLNLFYMIQARKSSTSWSSNQILGTLAIFKF